MSVISTNSGTKLKVEVSREIWNRMNALGGMITDNKVKCDIKYYEFNIPHNYCNEVDLPRLKIKIYKRRLMMKLPPITD